MAPSAAARRLRSVARALGERRASLPARNDVAGAASEAEIAEVEYLWEDSDEARAEPLSQKQIDFFMSEGYLLMPGILGEQYSRELRGDIDQMTVDRKQLAQERAQERETGAKVMPDLDYFRRRRIMTVSYEHYGNLVSYPPLVDKVCQLMAQYGNGRTDCPMHHANASIQGPGTPPNTWHNDYHRPYDTTRKQLMVHIFMYVSPPESIDSIGALQILPRSQYAFWDSGAAGQLFGAEPLPGSRQLWSLPTGSCIICHSALLHGRAKLDDTNANGGDGQRYFMGEAPTRLFRHHCQLIARCQPDTSYCQPGEKAWPVTANRMEEEKIGFEKGLDRDGKYAFVWSTEHLYGPDEWPDEDHEAAMERMEYKRQVARQTAGGSPSEHTPVNSPRKGAYCRCSPLLCEGNSLRAAAAQTAQRCWTTGRPGATRRNSSCWWSWRMRASRRRARWGS